MSPRGGKRANAGRPRILPVKHIRRTVDVSEEQAETAVRLGNGNFAQGVRVALDWAYTAFDTDESEEPTS